MTDYRTVFENDYPGHEAFTASCLEPVFGPVRSAKRSLTGNLSGADSAVVKDIFIFGASNNFSFGEMNFFDVTLYDTVDLARSRVAIQRAVRKSLDSYQSAIVIFHHENGKGLWRLSFINKLGSGKETTSAKRYSYICGKGRPCRTASDRFLELEKIPGKKSMEDITAVFSIEALTREFFKRLFKWYDEWAVEAIRFPAGRGEKARLPAALTDETKKENRQHLIRLITRLIFVWFLRQKENLVPSWIFDAGELQKVLISFDPHSQTNGAYYNAVLQNLFFATLNCEIEERTFFDEADGRDGYSINTRFRDHIDKPMIAIPHEAFIEKFAAIPFLNGGLFDCLDRRDASEPQEYKDGFSRESKRAAFVPNCLFFGSANPVGDNARVGDGAREGLIGIFSEYNFTIEENTPQDIEIALDPELLGKVFENLLGTYNEETAGTARNESGSFYTPREIVEYMVDASLKEYLKVKLESGGGKSPPCPAPGCGAPPAAGGPPATPPAPPPSADTVEMEKKLDALFSYGEEGHGFNTDEVSALIQAIHDCKILDPACGSGAFPIGILNKLMFILGKLDPEYKTWKDDYRRKLFLIENCVYGVDIQPIAIQISKLRFFISLIVDQKASGAKENNYGIIALPNLETKFVAANTLIGIKREQGGLADPEIDRKQKELLLIRHKHFGAKSTQEKKALRDTDRKVSKELIELLKQDGFYNSADAAQMAKWNPYSQTEASAIFDPWWMFGIDQGYDVVIGNPPYVEPTKLKDMAALIKTDYEVYSGTADLSVYFIEKGIKLCKANGFLAYISTNKFFNTEYGQRVRKFLLGYQFRIFINFEQVAVFQNALVSTTIFGISVVPKTKDNFIHKQYYKMNHDDFIFQFTSDCRSGFETYKQSDLGAAEWSFSNSAELTIKEKIEFQNKRLGEIEGVCIYRGVTTGYNPAFIIREETKKALIEADCKNREIIKPMLQGRNIRKWVYEETNDYLLQTGYDINIQKNYPAIYERLKQYSTELKKRSDQGVKWWNLRACKYYSEFEKEKIIWGLTADKWAFAYDSKKHYLPSNGYILTSTKIPVKYLLALLNSNLIKYYFGFIGVMTAGGAYTLKHGTIQALPIKIAKYSKPFIDIVDKIIAAKAAAPKADTSALERQIDSLVYRLYNLTYEEIKVIEPDFPLNRAEYEGREVK
jgi:type I restriction-modification system DNA methylase subunit